MICSGRLIYDKIWGGGDVLFVAEKMEEEEEMRKGERRVAHQVIN
jgi:hypothetical protein